MTSSQEYRPIAVVSLAVSCLFWLGLLWFIWPFTVDDAFISFRYARHLAEGYGLVWNVGGSPSEGYTNFLWVLAMTVPFEVPLPVQPFAKTLGILSALGIVGVYLRLFRRVFEGRPSTYAALTIAGGLFLLNPLTAIHSVSGMETMFYVFVVLLLLSESHRLVSDLEADGYRFGFIALVAGLTRPEGVGIAVALSAAIVGLRYRATGDDRSTVLTSFALPVGTTFVLPGAVYMIARIQYFGLPLPLTFYAKSDAGILSMHGLRQTISAGSYVAPFLLLLGVVAVYNADGLLAETPLARRVRRLMKVTGVASVSAIAVYPFSDIIMNFDHRHFMVLFCMVYGLTGAITGFAFSRDRWAASVPGPLRSHPRAILVTLLLILSMVNAPFIANIQEERSSAEGYEEAHAAIGMTLRAYSDTGLSVASTDAGQIAYYSHLRHIDLAGLTTPPVALGRDGLSYALEQHVDVVILIAADPTGFPSSLGPEDRSTLRRSYSRSCAIQYKANYYLVPYVRDDAPNQEQVLNDLGALCSR